MQLVRLYLALVSDEIQVAIFPYTLYRSRTIEIIVISIPVILADMMPLQLVCKKCS